MAYALGYDSADFESDDEDSKASASSSSAKARGRVGVTPVQTLPTPLEMDTMDIATLERLEWMEALGYRDLSSVTRVAPNDLRRHFWASRLKHTSPEYVDIDYYFRNSHSHGHGVKMRIKRIVNLKRYNENNCDYTNQANVQLLWHGTRTANVAGILTNGFRLPTTSGMFGRGVYFADRVTKSQQYCRVGGTRGSTGVLFLCAVNLGRMYESPSAMGQLTAPPPGYDSVKGCGNSVPDPRVVKTYRGAKIPCGATVSQTQARAGMGQGVRGLLGVGLRAGGNLLHNEYIVYELSKIAILFLIEFEIV